jgi:hypothetical protein
VPPRQGWPRKVVVIAVKITEVARCPKVAPPPKAKQTADVSSC